MGDEHAILPQVSSSVFSAEHVDVISITYRELPLPNHNVGSTTRFGKHLHSLPISYTYWSHDKISETFQEAGSILGSVAKIVTGVVGAEDRFGIGLECISCFGRMLVRHGDCFRRSCPWSNSKQPRA